MAAPAKTPRRHARFHSPYCMLLRQLPILLPSITCIRLWNKCEHTREGQDRCKWKTKHGSESFWRFYSNYGRQRLWLLPIKCFSKCLERAMLTPYLPAWNSSLKPVPTPMTDITTACGSVMVHFRMLKVTTKHKGFGIRPRQDPRRLRSHNRRWDGGAKVSRSSDRIYPRSDSDVGRSNEVLRVPVFKIKIFKDSLCSIFRLLKIISQLFSWGRHFTSSRHGSGS